MPYSDFPPVLVVDDIPLVAEVVVSTLQQLGFRDIDSASDGTAALSKLRERRYGLIISDWNMQPMTGYELLRLVRADVSLKSTPFVMMTIRSHAEFLPAAYQAGVNACLLKPFTPTTLREAIVAACGTGRPAKPSTWTI